MAPGQCRSSVRSRRLTCVSVSWRSSNRRRGSATPQCDHTQPHALRHRSGCRLVAGSALVTTGNVHHCTGDLPSRFSQGSHVCTVVCVGQPNQDGQRLPQRIDGRVHLRVSAACVPIDASMPPAFWWRREHPVARHRRTGSGQAVRDHAPQYAHIAHRLRNCPRLPPALRLRRDPCIPGTHAPPCVLNLHGWRMQCLRPLPPGRMVRSGSNYKISNLVA